MARDQPGGDNDLALITLDRKVNFTEDVRPICVGDTRTAVRPEDKVTEDTEDRPRSSLAPRDRLGKGRQGGGSPPAVLAREVSGQLSDNDLCPPLDVKPTSSCNKGKRIGRDNLLCASGAASEDSGGPVVIKDGEHLVLVNCPVLITVNIVLTTFNIYSHRSEYLGGVHRTST